MRLAENRLPRSHAHGRRHRAQTDGHPDASHPTHAHWAYMGAHACTAGLNFFKADPIKNQYVVYSSLGDL